MIKTAQHHYIEQDMFVHWGYWPVHEVCRNDETVQCMKHLIHFKSKVMTHRIYKARTVRDQYAMVKWNRRHGWALGWTSHNYSPWELPVQTCAAKQPVSFRSTLDFIPQPDCWSSTALRSNNLLKFQLFTPQRRFPHSGKCLRSFIQKHKEDKTVTNYREGH